ncbi:MAG: lipoyl(octanoyl) transferase LipB [Deltaproteobacteria bacterium]|nr:lipoyl(octanoyl) transferase LipB [Deltaproteobacteria bacterium]
MQNSTSNMDKLIPAPSDSSRLNPKSQIPNSKSKGSHREPCYTVNLGMIDYNRAWKLQSSLVAARTNGLFNRDTILFLEHPAVFTLGRRGGRDYLQVDESFLNRAEIPVVQAERGGYITYHGPGQLVVYPIIDLEARRLGVPDFVSALEEIMLQSVKAWGLRAQRNSANAGIWIGNHKMGSIGIALRKGISFHGLALNVNVDLTPFSWIQPCGLKGVSMTSVRQELGREIPMPTAVQTVRRFFNSVLGFELYDISYSELKEQL